MEVESLSVQVKFISPPSMVIFDFSANDNSSRQCLASWVDEFDM